MRAVVVPEPGGRDVLELRQLPDPAPEPGEVLIEVVFAGCNWSDIQKRQGVYPDPVSYPAVPGLEVSGRVAEVGRGVGDLTPGQRVAAITGPAMLGGYATRCVVGREYVIPLPEAVSDEVGAAFPVVALTAYHLLYSAHSIRSGEVILVHAAGGGVGLMLTQLARAAGARVIGTVSSPGKGERARHFGADRIVDRNQEDFVAAARSFTNERGVDLVIDSLGGDELRRSFDALRTYGKVINIGEAAGFPAFDIRAKLYENSTALAGFELLHAGPGSERWHGGCEFVMNRLRSGNLQVPIEGVYPLASARDAHAQLESRRVVGKLLLDATINNESTREE